MMEDRVEAMNRVLSITKKKEHIKTRSTRGEQETYPAKFQCKHSDGLGDFRLICINIKMWLFVTG